MTSNQDPSGVVLSRIYTRAGDEGTTMLGDMSRTTKTDTRLLAFATCEEANAAIGVAIAYGDGLPDHIAELLRRVQNDLFDVGADLCTPLDSQTRHQPLRVEAAYIDYLEQACDHYNEGLPTLRSFLLPGGAPAAALLHQARTTVRRAERAAWVALEEYGDGSVNPATARYLNRLSDLLFILGRAANAEHGDTLWQPGLSTRTTQGDYTGGTEATETS